MTSSWKKIKEDVLFDGYRKIVQKTFQLPNGKTAQYDIVQETNSICGLAFTTDNKVILVKQFRPGPEKILFEIPAGYINENELPEDAMKRELLEETGYQGDVLLTGTNVDSAYSTKFRYNFVITNCKKIQEPLLDENEFVEVVVLSLEEFKTILKSGENTDIETGYMGLHYLNLL